MVTPAPAACVGNAVMHATGRRAASAAGARRSLEGLAEVRSRIEKREAPRFTIPVPGWDSAAEADAAASAGAGRRAGGTDFMERLELGLSAVGIVDFCATCPGPDGIPVGEGRGRGIGARVTIH